MAPSTRADKVGEAIKQLRAFHAMGRKSLRKRPGRAAYRAGEIDEEAKKRVIHVDTLRKARSFADPAEGYSAEDLEDLCDFIMRVQPDQDEGTPVFSRRHLTSLLGVLPKKDRKALQRAAIRRGWSTAQLRAEIAKRRGTRSSGGRPPVAGKLEDVLTQLDQISGAWHRWRRRLDRPPEKAKRHVQWDRLPEPLHRKLKALGAAWEDVDEAVQNELVQTYRDRVPRAADREAAKNQARTRRASRGTGG
jgi:hypothetical protein